MSRMLAALARRRGYSCQWMVGPFREKAFRCGQSVCCISSNANYFRQRVAQLRVRGVVLQELADAAYWMLGDQGDSLGISPQEAASCAADALAAAAADWAVKRSMFCRGVDPGFPEDWDIGAWQHPQAPRFD